MVFDNRTLDFYRSIYSDPGVDRQEAAELTEFFATLNPPPDKLVWLRAQAFRVASEFINQDDKVSILRTINYIVHAIETNCLQPKDPGADGEPEGVEDMYRSLLDGLKVDSEENEELINFFKECNPASGSLVGLRASIFKVASEFLSEDDADHNVQLLRCVNCMVHAFETTCMMPKPFELVEDVDLDMSVAEAIQHLWDIDDNRLTPDQDYRMNVQRGKKPFWKEDAADEPLFTWVDPACFKRPTYAAFLALLDNYTAETGAAEVVTNAERQEVRTFLDRVLQTKPMQFCKSYCQHRGVGTGDFKALLNTIWFELYRRETRADSSGFEHVFVGEVKGDEVSGFHNWMQFYLEEKRGNLDYRGYIKPRASNQAETEADDQLLSLQFSWRGVEKFVSSSFIGVSPEFEFALYTLCFLVGEQENEVELRMENGDVFGLVIKCYKMARDKVGTSFPDIKEHYEE